MASLDPVERYVRGWVAHDADAVLATLNADGTYEDPSTGGPVSGQAFKAYMQGLWSAFPDLTFEKQSLGAMAADLIAAQWVMTGTNSGSMMGLPPTDMDIEMHPVLDNPLILLASRRHPLAGKRDIPLERLADEPFLYREPGSGTRTAVERHMKRHGFHPRIRDRKSTRLNSSHSQQSRMPSSA